MEEQMAIVNLTPHPLHIYPSQTPDRIQPGSVPAVRVIPQSQEYPPAPLGQTVIGTGLLHDGVVVEYVAFGPDAGQATTLPDPVPGTWFVVSLVVGLAAAHRDDLLVPHAYVRDLAGSIIGSRMLARPVRTVGQLTTAGATGR
jgi:hypothetical protein